MRALALGALLLGCGAPVERPAVEDAGASPEVRGPAVEPERGLAAELDALSPEALARRLSQLRSEQILEVEAALNPHGEALAAVALLKARAEFKAGRGREAEARLRAALEDAPPGPAAQAMTALLEALTAKSQVRPGRLGVLLPLSGPYRAIGKEALAGAKLALARAAGVELVVADTRGDAEQAVAALARLVEEEGVVAVLGPVGVQESRAVAQAAERLKVPLMALSVAPGLPEVGPWVFRHRLTRVVQASVMARYAVQRMRLRRFAVLYPDDDYGQEMSAAFAEAVRASGAEVRVLSAYRPDGSDLDHPVRKLVGRDRVAGRRADPHWATLNRKSKDPAFHLAPVVTFEALFVPDTGKRLRLVLPFLAYGDLELATERAPDAQLMLRKYNGASPQRVQLLGGAGFNDARLAERVEAASSAVFVEGFWAKAPESEGFVEAFLRKEKAAPSELAAHAYDAASMLAEAVTEAETRDEARAALGGLSHRGVFGPVVMDEAGEAHFPVKILTIRGGAVQVREEIRPQAEP